MSNSQGRGRVTALVEALLDKAFVRYVIVGGASAAVYFVSSIVMDVAGAPLWVSSGGARVLAIAVAFGGHFRYTFGLRTFDGGMVLRFGILRCFNILYGIAATYVVVSGIGAAYWVAATVVAATTPFIAYPAKKHWVFRQG